MAHPPLLDRAATPPPPDLTPDEAGVQLRLDLAPTGRVERRSALWPALEKAAVLVLCGLVLLGLAVLRAPEPPDPARGVDIDTAWIIALPALWRQGDISGRDFYFTYGPLAQWLFHLGGSLNQGASPLDQYTAIILGLWAVNITLYLLLLALIPAVDGRHALGMTAGLLTLGTIFFSYPGPRSLLCLVGVAVLARGMTASSRRAQIALVGLAGLLACAAQLITVEFGLYLALIIVALLGGAALVAALPVARRGSRPLLLRGLRPPGEYLRLLVVSLGVFALANLLLAVGFTLTSGGAGGLFDYQRLALESVRGYSYTMGLPWGASVPTTVGVVLLVGYVVVATLLTLRHCATSEAVLLLGLLLASLAQFKSATVRSDIGHIQFAIFGLLILFFLLPGRWGGQSRLSLVWGLVAVVLVATWPSAGIDPFKQMVQLVGQPASVQTRLDQIRRRSTSPAALVPQVVARAASAAPSMLNFPYENNISLGLGRRLVAPVLQAYAAHTALLQSRYVELMERRADRLDLTYGLDQIVSLQLDGVQHVTRLPLIFERLYRQYELRAPASAGQGYFILSRRPAPAELRTAPLTFSSPFGDGRLAVVKLVQPAQCSLIKLDLTVDYPVTATLGRPERMTVTVSSGGRPTHRSNLVAIEPGKRFTTYISLVDAARFYEVFDPAGAQLKTWDSLAIEAMSLDLLSVLPRAVVVHRVECVATGARAPIVSAPGASPDVSLNALNPDKWHIGAMTPVKTNPGQSIVWKVGSDPQFTYREPLSLCVGDYTRFYIRMAASPDLVNRGVDVFYLVNNQGTHNGDQLFYIPLAADGGLHDYVFDLTTLRLDPKSRLTGLRIDPIPDGSANGPSLVEIADIGFIHSGEPSKCVQ